jgi:hypothetical protein
MRWFGRAARWDADLFVEVSPDAFIFRSPRETFRWPAQAHSGTAAGLSRTLDWGYTPPAVPLDLFGAAGAGGPAPSRFEHLRAFLHEAFVHAAGKGRLRRRPRVVVHGAASLDALLLGYQYELLRRAALEADARSVRFTEKAPLAPPTGFELPVSLAELWMQARGRRGRMRIPGVRARRRLRRLRRPSVDE